MRYTLGYVFGICLVIFAAACIRPSPGVANDTDSGSSAKISTQYTLRVLSGDDTPALNFEGAIAWKTDTSRMEMLRGTTPFEMPVERRGFLILAQGTDPGRNIRLELWNAQDELISSSSGPHAVMGEEIPRGTSRFATAF